MDKETLANHISRLGKRDFEIACRLILHDIFNLIAVNVDGANDGGTDFAVFNSEGNRTKAAYQITTQKTDIRNKAYKDASKCISKLHVDRFYFLSTYSLSETDARMIEAEILNELKIPSTVLSPNVIADLLISNRLESKLLDATGFPDLRAYNSSSLDYREMALHSYTILSNDAKNLKAQIYDDSMILVLSDYPEGLNETEVIDKAIDLLCLSETKKELLHKRIGALFTHRIIQRTDENKITLTNNAIQDVKARKSLYERELEDLSAAQTDLFHEYGVDWTKEDSKQASIWIANAYIAQQLSILKQAKTSMASNSLLAIGTKSGIDRLKEFLIKEKKIPTNQIDVIIEKMIGMASSHPLIVKITSASVYIALEGSNPLTASKVLGANRWSDIYLLVEPTIGIPYLCSQLYKGKVNRYFDNAILSIKRAKELGIMLRIPYFYIKECAGHLHMARKFDGIDLDPNEMQYSSNAFVANYYALRAQGVHMPDSFMEYLATFSPAIKIEHNDYADWIREIMTNIQSFFTRSGIEFAETPTYTADELKLYETEYSYYLQNNNLTKPQHLMRNDIYALKYTEERVSKYGEHWMILTFDNSLTQVAQKCEHEAWVNNPFSFLDMAEITKDLSDKKFYSLVHAVASYSQQALSIGARIIDRVVLYASKEMQDWEFRRDINKFKSELITRAQNDNINYMVEVDQKTDDFLKMHGISMTNELENVDI